MIVVNAAAPSLCPKSKPEDMQKIHELYQFLDGKLIGVEASMKQHGFEKIEITIDIAETGGKEPQ